MQVIAVLLGRTLRGTAAGSDVLLNARKLSLAAKRCNGIILISVFREHFRHVGVNLNYLYSNAPLSLKWLPLYCEITNVVKVVTVEEVVFHKS